VELVIQLHRSPSPAERGCRIVEESTVKVYARYLIHLDTQEMLPVEERSHVASSMVHVMSVSDSYHNIQLQFMMRYVLPEYRGRFRGQTLTWVIRKRLKDVESYAVHIVRKNAAGEPEPIQLIFSRAEGADCAYMVVASEPQ